MALIDYTNLATMKRYLSLDSDTTYDTLLQDSITSASREVDRRTNRYFGEELVASLRTFDVTGRCVLFVHDIANNEDLVITNADSGAAITDFVLLPRDGIVDGVTGHPFTSIRSDNFSVGDVIEITAKWGWPEIPDVVIEATKMIAAETFMQKDTPLGIKGMDEFGSVRLRERQHIKDKLNLYTRYRVVIF